jgi:hypothetical protein
VNPRLQPLLVTATLALLTFVIIPGAQYMGNRGEFLTAPLPILRLLLVPAALLVVVALFALRLSPRRDFSRYTSVAAMLTLLVWTQAFLLVWDYGLLDGSPIDWRTPWWRGPLDASIWVAGLAAAVLLHRKLARPLATAAVVLVLLQAALLAADLHTHRDTLSLKATKRLAAEDASPMAHFSRTRNVLHIILDSFQADVFKDLLDGPDGAALREALAGFTYFEEHLGTFPATYLAMPVIVSGQVYRNHMPRAQFMESAYGGNTLFRAAKGAGYEVDLAADAWVLDLLTRAPHDNAYLTAQLPLVQEAARVLDLGLFRATPHWLKSAVYDDQQWLVQQWFAQSALLKFPYFTHNAFLAGVTRNLVADREAPVYKFFHLMTPHAPFVVYPDCSPVGAVVDRVRETVTAQSRCSLGFVVALLNRMKDAGIYDDALIVLMGDHGGHIPPYRFEPGRIVQGNYEYFVPADFVALATPLLAIKPPGAADGLQVSPALTSMTDVPATIDALAGLDGGLPGQSIWDPSYGTSGPRRFYAYKWSKLDPVSEYIELIQEHPVVGSAYDLRSWQIGPIFEPPHER